MTGREPTGVLSLFLGISLSLLILGILGYAVAKWCRGGEFWHRPRRVLYRVRSLKSVELELAPAFSISGSMCDAGGSYVRFHEGGRQD